MVSEITKHAITNDWRCGYRVYGIARARDVAEEEVIAVLMVHGVPWRRICVRDCLRAKQYPRARAEQLAALMQRMNNLSA